MKLMDAHGNTQERSSWLTVGKVYHVLSVIQDTRRKWLLRLISDDGVALFPLEQFEIVSARIPDAWIVDWNLEGNLALTTEAWSKPGFWESFYEMESPAWSIFEQEKEKIIAADP